MVRVVRGLVLIVFLFFVGVFLGVFLFCRWGRGLGDEVFFWIVLVWFVSLVYVLSFGVVGFCDGWLGEVFENGVSLVIRWVVL